MPKYDFLQRFHSNYSISSTRSYAGTPCWEWKMARRPRGTRGRVVRFKVSSKRPVTAYRWAYEQFVGPLSPNLTIDHLCNNFKCVNPNHLQAVPFVINQLRNRIKEITKNLEKWGFRQKWWNKLWECIMEEKYALLSKKTSSC